MDLKKSKRLIIIMAVVYWVFVVGIYAISNEQFRYSAVTGAFPSVGFVIGELVDDLEIRQTVQAPGELLRGIELMTGDYDRENSGSLTITILDSKDNVIAEKTVEVSMFENNKYTAIVFDQMVETEVGDRLVLCLTTQGCSTGNAITVYAGSILNGKEVTDGYLVNGSEAIGALCVKVNGYNNLTFYKNYWIIVVVAFVLLSVYTAHCWKNALRGKSNPLVSLLTVYSRYSFLLKQLVSRDFKSKYKRSSLGMAWSFMNPLLTMLVQYIVFSALFKSDIPNYPVYLLIGIVFFNFFNEAVSLGMTSITGNASLIKKVYMPKYIYPVSRIFSSLVNFGFALLPLFLVMIVTGTPFKISMLLLIFDIICLVMFIVGMTLLLSTAMTFFQDTQFLWGIVAMLWQYMTPIFYPETIIPVNFLPIYRLNPMYQFVSFARICVTEGISPAPMAYIQCIISAVAIMLLGAFVFKKQQNKFAMYL